MIQNFLCIMKWSSQEVWLSHLIWLQKIVFLVITLTSTLLETLEYYTVLVTIVIMLYITSLAVVQLPSRVWLFATPWTVALQASLFLTIFRNLPRFMSIDWVMPSNHLRPLGLIYFITGNLYLLIFFTYAASSPFSPLAITIISVSININLFSFWFVCFVRFCI